MAQLALTTLEAATIRGARDDKALKKAAINAVRTRLGIPASVKLILLVDPTDSPFLGILQKGTRYPLLAGADGKYAGVAVPAPVAPPAPVAAPAPAAGSRFVTAPNSVVYKIDRDTLRQYLGDAVADGAATVATPPAGMPALTENGYTLDTSDGALYFRA